MPQHTGNSQIDKQKTDDFVIILQQHIQELINIIPKNINKEEVDQQIKEFASQYHKLNLATKIANAGLVNQTNDNGSNLLSIAASVGHLTLVEDLITKGVAMDNQNRWNNTALHLASNQGFTKIVQLLIDRGISLDPQNEDGNTALHLATKKNHTEIVQTLITAGATLTLQNNYENTALHLAIKKGNSTIAEILLAAAQQTTAEQAKAKKLLVTLAKQKHKSAHKKVTFTLEERPEKQNKNSSSFVSQFYSKPKNINKALLTAAQNGDFPVILSLLNNSNINITDKSGNTALHLAAQHGHLNVVKLLLHQRAEVNEINKSGNTALHLAIQNGYIEITELLIDKRADIELETKNHHFSPLYFAVQNNHFEITKLLLAKNAKINSKVIVQLYHNISIFEEIERNKPEEVLKKAKLGSVKTNAIELFSLMLLELTPNSKLLQTEAGQNNSPIADMVVIVKDLLGITKKDKKLKKTIDLINDPYFIKDKELFKRNVKEYFKPTEFGKVTTALSKYLNVDLNKNILYRKYNLSDQQGTNDFRKILTEFKELIASIKEAKAQKATKAEAKDILVILLTQFYYDKIQKFTQINNEITNTPKKTFNLLTNLLAEEVELNKVLTIASTNTTNISKPQNSPVANNLSNSAEEKKTNLAPVSLTITPNLSNNMPNIAANITRKESETPSRLRSRLLNSYTYSSSKDKITKTQNPIDMPSPPPKEPLEFRSKPEIRSLEILPHSPSKTQNKIANPNSLSTPISHLKNFSPSFPTFQFNSPKALEKNPSNNLVDIQNSKGDTALHIAVKINENELNPKYQKILLEIILEYDPDKTIKNKQGQTAVQVAEKKQKHQLKELINKFGNYNQSLKR